MEDLASNKKVDSQSRRLSIIDFSSEDDSLLGSAPGFLRDDHSCSESQEQTSVDLFEPVDAKGLEEIPETDELMPLPSECSEPERIRKNEKYNLRKSLAWDSAFFTCEGVLDADELSTMISVDNKNQKKMLPGIQEEVRKSSESISTLGSDTLTLESVETSLFDDVRASIQQLRKPVIRAGESSKVGSGMRESTVSTGSEKVDSASQRKMKPKVAAKKLNISTQNPGKLTRPGAACPQLSQSVGARGGPTSSHMKLPKVSDKPIPSSTRVVKRASLCGDLSKAEKDHAKISAGTGNLVSKLPGSLRNVPRPSKSSSMASSITTTSGSTSTSSVKSGKPPSNSLKRKTDSKSGNPTDSSSSSNPKTPSRITSGGNKVNSGPCLSAHFVPSPSISPASSISDWSTESVSSISTSQLISRSSRDSIGKSSSKKVSMEFDTAQSVNNYDHQSSIGSATQTSGLPVCGALRASVGPGGLPPTSKPSGLRLPSPKIGFFDGVTTAIRTPKRNVPSNLPKGGAVISPWGSGIKSKLGKVNPEKAMALVREKPDSTRISSATKPKVSFSVEASKAAATKAISDLVTETKTPAKIDQEDHPKTEEVENVTSETKLSAHEDMKFTGVCGDHIVINNLNSISNLENTSIYEEGVKDATQREVEFNNDKPKSHSEDQIDCLIGQVREMAITATGDVVAGGALASHLKFGSEDNNGVSDSAKELSKPVVSISPTTENLSCPRIPFSAKDSLCNIGGTFDDSKVSPEVEKSSQFPFSEDHFDREQQA